MGDDSEPVLKKENIQENNYNCSTLPIDSPSLHDGFTESLAKSMRKEKKKKQKIVATRSNISWPEGLSNKVQQCNMISHISKKTFRCQGSSCCTKKI